MTPDIATPEVWRQQRIALLAEEKALTRAREALAERRRKLPLVRIDTDYRFDTESGPAGLADLFAGKRQLAIYHFMFGADWTEGCQSCSFWTDGFSGIAAHLAARDTRLVLVSKAPLDRLLAYRERMGWTLPWVSSGESGFNEDFHVTFPPGADRGSYNFGSTVAAQAEMPGFSTFLKADGAVFYSYSTFSRGIDALNPAYQILDLTPLGRQEDGAYAMSWVRRHDRYDDDAPGVLYVPDRLAGG